MRSAWIIGASLLASIAACGGGGGGSNSPALPQPPAQNQAPVANAGPDQAGVAGGTITLNGSASTDPDGTVASYTWTQSAGPTVTLSNSNASQATFCAPSVAASTELTFNLGVVDNAGLASTTSDTVTVTLTPHPGGTVTVTGTVTFARVPTGLPPTALNYLQTRQDPARRIAVQAMCGGQQVIASRVTDASGSYSMDVPANTPLAIRAVSEMVSAVAPQWNFRVVDDDNANQLYTFLGTVFDSSTPGGAQNLAIPSGWDAATRTATGTRAAAPFAILDTVYTAALAVLGVEAVNFPPLNLDWGPGNVGGQTFYRGGPGVPTIVLSGEANVDTDEYDQHVIAHEFGHYLEDNFSRADSIGGQHAAGDRLDMRVAFGEGYGYAFSAIVLNDPTARDTFGASQSQLSFFSVEQNSVTNAGWFSEASNWAILWDLFDPANDDPLELGLSPLWQVLRVEQAATPALTSIFPFISALKQPLSPAERGQIDQIVTGQGIVSGSIEPFGGSETNSGGNPTNDVLPIYTAIQIDGPSRTVRSVAPAQAGSGQGQNKLSNHRFLRLNVPMQQNVRFRVAAPAGRDADIVIFRRGTIVDIGQEPANEDFMVNLTAGEYVLDVYDCQNAECGDQESYDYQPTDIAVTVSNN